MDPDTGELTLAHEYDRSFSFHAGATPANTEFDEVGGTLYAYAENREFMDVFKFDASTGNWSAEAEYRWSDVNPTGVNGGYVGPADVQHSRTAKYLCDFTIQWQWPFERMKLMKPRVCQTSQHGRMASMGVGATNMHSLKPTMGPKWSPTMAPTMRVWDMGDDGTSLGLSEVSWDTGGYYDSWAASVTNHCGCKWLSDLCRWPRHRQSQSEPEGNTIWYDPATDSVVRQINNKLNGRGTYSVDADGYIYVTTNSLSGGGSTTPLTMVLDPITTTML